MNSSSIIAPPVQIAQEPLSDIYPDEIDFFKDRFIWTGQTKGFYTRRAYEPERDQLGRTLPKWRPFKTRGDWQPLFTELADALVQKHLVFPGLHRPFTDWLRTEDDETAFWLGTMAGMKSYYDCIDLDSHELVGWTSAPTRWHPDFNPSTGGFGPWDVRSIPVVRPSLRFFQMVKVVYDSFPNRIWSFSSGNLGLAVWKTHARRQLTHVLYRRTQNRLANVGLPFLEHYPKPPSSATTFGRCHRRPCGMDTGIITPHEVITHPIDQIQAFMSPPQTPCFGRILDAWFSQMDLLHERFLSSGTGPDHERLALDDRMQVVDECRRVVADVWRWFDLGCPIDRQLLAGDQQAKADDGVEAVPADVAVKPETTVMLPDLAKNPELGLDGSRSYQNADLKAVAGSGRWVQFVKFLVENGLPCENMFSEAISTLALWFGFVELCGADRDHIKHVLKTYVLRNHNNMVSRLIAGQQSEVLAHVDRIVDYVLNSEDDAGKRLFSELRQKRSSGQYQTVYFFEPQILDESQSTLPLQSQTSPPSYLLCGGLIQSSDAQWEYVPDDTPLPEDIMNRIRAAFKTANRQLRQNRQTGRYTTLDAITRFFNYFCTF